MSDDEADDVAAAPKVWKLGKKPHAVESGRELLELLEDSGTGRDKLEVGFALFPVDEDTGFITEDVDAEKVAKAFFRHKGVPALTKEKVKAFVEAGEWSPRPNRPAELRDRFAQLRKAEPKKPGRPRKKDEDAPAE